MIRQIKSEDRADYLRLSKEFYASEAVMHPIPEEHFLRTFQQIQEGSPYVRGYLLESGGQLAGYALLALTWSNEAGGLVVWLEEAFVLPEHQGKGLGKELLFHVEQEFAGKAARLRLEVEEDNDGAIRLYKRTGYQEFPYRQMIKEL